MHILDQIWLFWAKNPNLYGRKQKFWYPCNFPIPFPSYGLFLLDPFRPGNSAFGFVCLSVITFSFSEYWIIWWFSPCKPYIFWKHITLATSNALFWPSTTNYQPVPQYSDPLPPSTNQYLKEYQLADFCSLTWPHINAIQGSSLTRATCRFSGLTPVFGCFGPFPNHCNKYP